MDRYGHRRARQWPTDVANVPVAPVVLAWRAARRISRPAYTAVRSATEQLSPTAITGVLLLSLLGLVAHAGVELPGGFASWAALLVMSAVVVALFAVSSRCRPDAKWLGFGWALALLAVGALVVLPLSLLPSAVATGGGHHARHLLYITGQGVVVWMAWVVVPSHHRAAVPADGPRS